MIETISGVITAVLIILLRQLLAKYFTQKLFAATVLVAIAFIYVGFSLKGNPASSIILEAAVALIFYFVAIIGYTRNNLLMAFGIMFHGVWDICHHKGHIIGTNIPDYWPSFCLVVDIIDGVYFLIIFKSLKKFRLLHQS